MQELLTLDTNLFVLLNHVPHTDILNLFFSFLSGVGSWGLIWVVIAVILFIWEEKKNHQKLFSLILALGMSALVVEVIKNITRRFRPETIAGLALAIHQQSDSFSFPSGHTTLAFAGSFILGVHHKKLKWFYYILALLIAYSRIYLGKHYPSDVIAGAMIGVVIGLISDRLLTKYRK